MAKTQNGAVCIGLEAQKRLKAFCEIKHKKQKEVVEEALSKYFTEGRESKGELK